jgi:MYND finger
VYATVASHASYDDMVRAAVEFCRERGILGRRADELSVVSLDDFKVVARYDMSKPGATLAEGRAETERAMKSTTLAPARLHEAGAARAANLMLCLGTLLDAWEHDLRDVPEGESPPSTFDCCSAEGCSARTSKDGQPLRTCAQCRTQPYCSKECQRRDWRARHKAMCDDTAASSKSDV